MTASSESETSQWTAITFRSLVPRSDVCVVTLPLEAAAAKQDSDEEESRGGGGGRRSSTTSSSGNDSSTKRILHFVIGGDTTETNEASIVESIEWKCRRSWRMASLNRPRIGCGAALLRGVIYTVGYVVAE